MFTKLAIFALGYMLGARAGRQRYDAIVKEARDLAKARWFGGGRVRPRRLLDPVPAGQVDRQADALPRRRRVSGGAAHPAPAPPPAGAHHRLPPESTRAAAAAETDADPRGQPHGSALRCAPCPTS